jgi:hypothetical protein
MRHRLPPGIDKLHPAPSSRESMHMNERQRRSDEPTANAVARGLNILDVRNAKLARQYMEHKQVPEHVIARVIERPELRRQESPGQSVSEAITPTAPGDQ